MTVSTVAKLERPGKEPSWGTAVKLAEALGVSLDTFKDSPIPDVAEGPTAEKGPRRKQGK